MSAETDPPPNVAPFEAVSNFWTSLDKVVRGFRLYRGKGQMLDRLYEELLGRVGPATEAGPFTVRVTAIGLMYDGKPTINSDNRIPYLFQLYCDGVRELTVLDGVEEEELRELCAVLATDPKNIEGDLVTMIWALQLKKIRYYAVDSFASGASLDEAAASSLAEQQEGQLDRDGQGEEMALSSDDTKVLQSDDALQWVRVATAPQLLAGDLEPHARQVVARFEAPPDYATFLGVARRVSEEGEDASALVLDLWDGLVRGGDLEGVVAVLGSMKEEAARRERDAILSPDRMSALAPLFAEHHGRLQPDLTALVDDDRYTAGLLALLTHLPPGDAAKSWEDFLKERGLDITPFYEKRLASEDEEEILEAVAALGRIGSGDALKAVSTALSNTLTSVRRAALEVLKDRYHESARVALGRALRDPDKDNRLLALEVVGQSGDARFGWSLVTAADSPEFESMDADEQEAFYGAIADLRDNRTLDHFRKLLARKTLLSAKGAMARRQLLAADALARMGTDASKAVLEENQGRWHHPSAVKDALRSALSAWRKR